MRFPCDLGGSGSKGFYFWEKQVHPLLMESQVSLMKKERIPRLKTSQGAPEDTCYLRVGDSYWAVGTLGRILEGDSGIKSPKSELAVRKVLAALGCAWEHIGNLPRQAEVNLSLLLPVNEYWKDSFTLEEELRKAAQGFMCRDHELEFQFPRLSIVPEGGGLFMYRLLQLKQDIRKKVIAVLMFGHRNLSVLIFEKGNPPVENVSTSKGPGFMNYLEQCAAEIPELKADSAVLFEAVINNTSSLFVQGRSLAYDMPEITAHARLKYLNDVELFLKQWLPESADEIIVAGGATHNIFDELQELFERRHLSARVLYTDELEAEIRDLLERNGQLKKEEITPILLRRLSDVYGAFKRQTAVMTTPKESGGKKNVAQAI